MKMNINEICSQVTELRRDIKSFVEGNVALSTSQVKEKLQNIKKCEEQFKNNFGDEDNTSRKAGLDAIKNAYLVSLNELENLGVFQSTSNSGTTRQNRPGRPEKTIDVEKIRILSKSGMKLVKIAKVMGISYSKVYATVKATTGSSPKKMIYTNISEPELDERLSKFETEQGRHGRRMTEGWLRSQGIRLPNAKTKIKLSNERRQLEPLPIGNRLKRRQYKVRGPGSLFHIDTHHKLGRKYGIVIHGCTDGYSKLCIYCRANDANNSESALNFFVSGCNRVMFPSRVRTDRGTENVKIWQYMNDLRGVSHKPVFKGPSTNNTRIERFWGYLTQGFVVKKYRTIFETMEEDGVLNLDNDNEMYLLHLVYLPRVEKDLKEFVETYNNHRIEGHGIPIEVFLQGCFEVYGIDSPRLNVDFNVSQFDIPGEELDILNQDEIRDIRDEPIVRNVSLNCSEAEKEELHVQLQQTFGDINYYSSENSFCLMSNSDARNAFIQCKNVLAGVLNN